MKVSKKSILIVILSVCFTLMFASLALAAPRVFVDGNEVYYDQKPIIQNGRVLVPVRATFNALGADVYWWEDTREVEAHSTRGEILIMQIANSRASLQSGYDMFYYNMDVPPQIINSRTLIPLRFVSEVLDAEVDWDSASQTVYIYTSAHIPDTDYGVFTNVIKMGTWAHNNVNYYELGYNLENAFYNATWDEYYENRFYTYENIVDFFAYIEADNTINIIFSVSSDGKNFIVEDVIVNNVSLGAAHINNLLQDIYGY